MQSLNRQTPNWQNPYNVSLTVGHKTILVGKAKQKPPELCQHTKIVHQKQYCIPEGIVQITAALKNLKDAGEEILITSHVPYLTIPFTFSLCRRQMDVREL